MRDPLNELLTQPVERRDVTFNRESSRPRPEVIAVAADVDSDGGAPRCLNEERAQKHPMRPLGILRTGSKCYLGASMCREGTKVLRQLGEVRGIRVELLLGAVLCVRGTNLDVPRLRLRGPLRTTSDSTGLIQRRLQIVVGLQVQPEPRRHLKSAL